MIEQAMFLFEYQSVPAKSFHIIVTYGNLTGTIQARNILYFQGFEFSEKPYMVNAVAISSIKQSNAAMTVKPIFYDDN